MYTLYILITVLTTFYCSHADSLRQWTGIVHALSNASVHRINYCLLCLNV